MDIAETMFAVLQPSNTIFGLLAVGSVLLLARRRAGAVLVAVGVVLLGVFGLLPVGSALLRPLEAVTSMPAIDDPPDAVVLLGGFIRGRPTSPVPLDLDDSADRLTATAMLAHRWPGVPVVVTDGAAGDATPGAILAADWLEGVGVPRSQLVVEPNAASTWDNAVFSAALLPPTPEMRVVLVTSAWHMPRALAVFRAAGWPEPIPYPVDPRSGTGGLAWPRSVADGLAVADVAAREWVAIGWYALTGRLEGFRL
jgi:uncharacterized SAM-binding protein YcdF (DUF218 family)